MLTITRKQFWEVIHKYEKYKQVDELLADNFVNQWISVEESKWDTQYNKQVLDSMELQIEKIKSEQDIVDRINNVDTHICSKYCFENINDKACAFCKETGKQATCYGMRMFCLFEQDK